MIVFYPSGPHTLWPPPFEPPPSGPTLRASTLRAPCPPDPPLFLGLGRFLIFSFFSLFIFSHFLILFLFIFPFFLIIFCFFLFLIFCFFSSWRGVLLPQTPNQFEVWEVTVTTPLPKPKPPSSKPVSAAAWNPACRKTEVQEQTPVSPHEQFLTQKLYPTALHGNLAKKGFTNKRRPYDWRTPAPKSFPSELHDQRKDIIFTE